MTREWEKQDLDAMERLALSGAETARWDSLDTRRLLPSRAARRFAGLKRMLLQEDPVAGYHVDASAAFRVPFRQDADESVMRKAAEAARGVSAVPEAVPPGGAPAPERTAAVFPPDASEPAEKVPAESETGPSVPASKPNSSLARMMRRRRRRLFRHRM